MTTPAVRSFLEDGSARLTRRAKMAKGQPVGQCRIANFLNRGPSTMTLTYFPPLFACAKMDVGQTRAKIVS
jgi:hypothetical protein